MTIIRTNLDVLRTDSGVSSILAVLQKAYAEAQLLTIDVVSESPTVPFVDRNTNWQIKNAIMTGVKPKAGTLDVVQNVAGNFATCTPTFQVAATEDTSLSYRMVPMEKAYVRYNSSVDNVGDLKEFVMESARYMVLTNDLLSIMATRGARPNLGTDFLLDCEIYTVSDIGNYYEYKCGSFLQIDDPKFGAIVAALTSFTVHPYIYIVQPKTYDLEGGKKTTWTVLGSIGEIDKYTVLDSDMLSALNQAALESIYLVNVKPEGSGI